MELTIEQALEQGVAAHKQGKLQDAERLYRAILQSQPAHPDANHNLGLLAVSVNKADAALPLFKTALETNPRIEQFWLSYIDALIKEKQFDNAKRVLEQAKTQGVDEARLNSLEVQGLPKNQKLNTARVNPPQELINNLLEHYQNGQLSDAEKLAVSLTQEFPKHQFGWKVLGAVLKQVGRISESLVPSQNSVQLVPQDAEAHNNLGVTLQELGRLDESKASLKQAIVLKPDYADAHYNLGITLKELGSLDEAVASYHQAIGLKSDYVGAHGNLGITLHELGRFDEAETSYNQAIALKPNYAEAHNNLGVTLKDLGRLTESEASLKQAIALKPNYAEAHNNLGVTLKKLRRFDEAEASYIKAIALKPDFAEAHNNLGITLKELGRFDEAESSYNQAIVLKPDYAEAHNNLGVTLQEIGRSHEAVATYNRAIALKPDFAEAYVNLGIAIKNVRFTSSNRKLYPPLTQLLSPRNFARPADLASSILSLLKQDPLMKDLLVKKNFPVSLKEVTSIIKSLDELPLLHHLMRVCPLPNLQFEGLFVAMRRLFLKNLDKMEVSPELTYFLSTLSLHCFTNEYVYAESDEEICLVEELEAKISQTVAQLEQPKVIQVLCLASYRPLYQYHWHQKLAVLDNLKEVKARLIEEPLAEKVIAQDIPVLGEISDDVSLRVREQYEESPYPRWVKLGIPIKTKSIAAICDELKLQLHSKSIRDVAAPTILIAGCGTGQHSIGTAARFHNCHVTLWI